MTEIVSEEHEALIPPSSQFIFWPGADPPMAEEVRIRLRDWGQAVDQPDENAEETVWSFWFEAAERPVSYLVWSEPVTAAHRVLLEQVRWRSRRQRQSALGCQWVVGVEGPISLRQPATDYQYQLRICEAIADDGVPVVFDANALQFRTLQDVRHLTGTRTPPRSTCLYAIHKIGARKPGMNEPLYWLHTHGLQRTATPDLELFGVPLSLVPAACELLEAVADLWIEYSTPDPEVPFEIGAGLEVAWRPWQTVVTEMPRRAAGGAVYRQQDLGHVGYRAVLVEARSPTRSPQPPLGVFERLMRSQTTLYKTMTESRRMAQMARERWGSFGLLFAGRHPQDWRFSVKLNFPLADGRAGEHLWFDVLQLRPGQIHARLVSQPTTTCHLEVGSAGWFRLEQLSDWRIFTPTTIYDPETADCLLEDDMADLLIPAGVGASRYDE